MRSIIDTNIAIYLRDGHPGISEAVAELPLAPDISVVTRVELEGGIYRDGASADLLRQRVDALLAIVNEIPFTHVEAEAYGRIVAQCGYSRRRVADRMIAATALAADATLITINGADFQEIEGLKLSVWPSPAGL